MKDQELVNKLREHAEWQRGNEWETPITLGDDLVEAADRIANQNTHILALQKEIEGLRAQLPRHPLDAAAGAAGGGKVMQKKILDVTCGSRTIWFNKQHPAAVYCDIRDEECTAIWKSTKHDSERSCIIHPDVQCNFTALPFPDNSFALVVFDPPHLQRVGENAWMREKYGKLDDNWPQMLHDGFRECMRVLKPDGVLIFKWAETQIPAAKVWKAIGEKPLFGHHSGKKSGTFWGCFMKLKREEM